MNTKKSRSYFDIQDENKHKEKGPYFDVQIDYLSELSSLCEAGI